MVQQREREMVKKAYPSTHWAAKVDKMSAAQIFAIYIRLSREGKIKN